MAEKRTEGLPGDLIGLKQAAAILPPTGEGGRISLRTLRRWVRTGKLPAWRIDRFTWVSRADVLGLVRAVEPVTPGPARARTEGHRRAVERLREAGYG